MLLVLALITLLELLSTVHHHGGWVFSKTQDSNRFFRMGTASRSVELKRDVPGPGAYELRNKVRDYYLHAI